MAKLQANFPSQILSLQGFDSKDSVYAAISDAAFRQCSTLVLSAVFDAFGGYQILIDSSDVSISDTQYPSQTCRAAWGRVDPDTGAGSNPYDASSACPTMDYFQSLFIATQVAIDSSLYSATFTPKFYAAPLPAFKQYLGQGFTIIVPVYLAIALSFFGGRLSVQVVSEKENKIRDGMRMMGCSSVVYFFSWISSTLLVQLPVVIIYTLALVIAKIIYQSNVLLLFLSILLYVLAQTTKYRTFCSLFASFLPYSDRLLCS